MAPQCADNPHPLCSAGAQRQAGCRARRGDGEGESVERLPPHLPPPLATLHAQPRRTPRLRDLHPPHSPNLRVLSRLPPSAQSPAQPRTGPTAAAPRRWEFARVCAASRRGRRAEGAGAEGSLAVPGAPRCGGCGSPRSRRLHRSPSRGSLLPSSLPPSGSSPARPCSRPPALTPPPSPARPPASPCMCALNNFILFGKRIMHLTLPGRNNQPRRTRNRCKKNKRREEKR